MSPSLVPVVLGLLQLAAAAAVPAVTLQDLEVADDTMSIGSYIREVRAAAPDDFHKTYEKEADGEIGYSRKKTGGGKKGYQHFDSYHKKAGDNYEFEKQDSFGLEEKEQTGAHSHPHEKREKYRESEKKTEAQEDDPEEFKEKVHEELKEGAPDGNGGVEAYGHDPADYILPEKYTYGNEEEEYNF